MLITEVITQLISCKPPLPFLLSSDHHLDQDYHDDDGHDDEDDYGEDYDDDHHGNQDDHNQLLPSLPCLFSCPLMIMRVMAMILMMIFLCR